MCEDELLFLCTLLSVIDIHVPEMETNNQPLADPAGIVRADLQSSVQTNSEEPCSKANMEANSSSNRNGPLHLKIDPNYCLLAVLYQPPDLSKARNPCSESGSGNINPRPQQRTPVQKSIESRRYWR